MVNQVSLNEFIKVVTKRISDQSPKYTIEDIAKYTMLWMMDDSQYLEIHGKVLHFNEITKLIEYVNDNYKGLYTEIEKMIINIDSISHNKPIDIQKLRQKYDKSVNPVRKSLTAGQRQILQNQGRSRLMDKQEIEENTVKFEPAKCPKCKAEIKLGEEVLWHVYKIDSINGYTYVIIHLKCSEYIRELYNETDRLDTEIQSIVINSPYSDEFIKKMQKSDPKIEK